MTSRDLYTDSSVCQVGGVRIRMAPARGVGPPRFLLLHGNPGSMRDFGVLAEALSLFGEVAAFDFPGHGYSPSPDKQEDFLLDASAAYTVGVLDRLGWDQAILVGHSHGGGVAQRVATLHPERVAALGLLASLGISAHGSYRILSRPGIDRITAFGGWLVPRLPMLARRTAVRAFMAPLYAPGQLDEASLASECAMLAANPLILRNMAWMTRGGPCAELARGAGRIAAPTVVMHGTHDPLASLHYGEELGAAIPNARFVPVANAGHLLPQQFPDLVVDELRHLAARISPVRVSS